MSSTWSADTAGNSDNTSYSTTVTRPTLTPSGPGELYVGFARVDNTGAAGAAPVFTYDVTSPLGFVYLYNSNVSGPVAPSVTQSPVGRSLSVGVLLKATGSVGPSTSSASSWDVVSGGSIPLNLNDAATTSGATTNTSYIYGDLLFGGTAPLEQITTTSSGTSVSCLVSNPTGGARGLQRELGITRCGPGDGDLLALRKPSAQRGSVSRVSRDVSQRPDLLAGRR